MLLAFQRLWYINQEFKSENQKRVWILDNGALSTYYILLQIYEIYLQNQQNCRKYFLMLQNKQIQAYSDLGDKLQKFWRQSRITPENQKCLGDFRGFTNFLVFPPVISYTFFCNVQQQYAYQYQTQKWNRKIQSRFYQSQYQISLSRVQAIVSKSLPLSKVSPIQYN